MIFGQWPRTEGARKATIMLLDQVRAKLRLLHHAWATEEAYVAWIKRFLVFHKRCEVWQDQAHCFE
jgi:hypothetical protein